MKIIIVKALALVLALFTVASLVACDFGGNAATETSTETETGSGTGSNTEAKKDFNYLNADMSKYISLTEDDYNTNTVTLGTEFLVTDELVQKPKKKKIRFCPVLKAKQCAISKHLPPRARDSS